MYKNMMKLTMNICVLPFAVWICLQKSTISKGEKERKWISYLNYSKSDTNGANNENEKKKLLKRLKRLRNSISNIFIHLQLLK